MEPEPEPEPDLGPPLPAGTPAAAVKLTKEERETAFRQRQAAAKAARAAKAQAAMSPNPTLSGRANSGAAGGPSSGPPAGGPPMGAAMTDDDIVAQAKRIDCLFNLAFYLQQNPDTDLFNDNAGFTLAHRLVTMSTELVKKHAELLNEYILTFLVGGDYVDDDYTFSDDVVRHFLVFGDDLWNNKKNEDGETGSFGRQVRNAFKDSYPTGTIKGRNGEVITDVNPVYLYLKFMSDSPNTTSRTAGGATTRHPEDGPPGGQGEVKGDFRFSLDEREAGRTPPPIFDLMQSLAFILLKCKKHVEDPYKGGVTSLFTEKFGEHLQQLLNYSVNFREYHDGDGEDPYLDIFEQLVTDFQLNEVVQAPARELWGQLMENENAINLAEFVAQTINDPDSKIELSSTEAWNRLTDSVLSLNREVITDTEGQLTEKYGEEREGNFTQFQQVHDRLISKISELEEQGQPLIDEIQTLEQEIQRRDEKEREVEVLRMSEEDDAQQKLSTVEEENRGLKITLKGRDDTYDLEQRLLTERLVQMGKANADRDMLKAQTEELSVKLEKEIALAQDSKFAITQYMADKVKVIAGADATERASKELCSRKNTEIYEHKQALNELRKSALLKKKYHELYMGYRLKESEAYEAGSDREGIKQSTDVYLNEIVFDEYYNEGGAGWSDSEEIQIIKTKDTKIIIEWVTKRNTAKSFSEWDQQLEDGLNRMKAGDVDFFEGALNEVSSPPVEAGAERVPEIKEGHATFVIMVDSVEGGDERTTLEAISLEDKLNNLMDYIQEFTDDTELTLPGIRGDLMERYGLAEGNTHSPNEDKLVAEIMSSMYHSAVTTGDAHIQPTYYVMVVKVTEGETLEDIRKRIVQLCSDAIVDAEKFGWGNFGNNPFSGDYPAVSLATFGSYETPDHPTMADIITSSWYYTKPYDSRGTNGSWWVPFGGEEMAGNISNPAQLAKIEENEIKISHDGNHFNADGGSIDGLSFTF